MDMDAYCTQVNINIQVKHDLKNTICNKTTAVQKSIFVLFIVD